MAWTVIVARSAQKQLAKLPARDQARILEALTGMQHDPHSGDTKRLTDFDGAFRRRVGAYRVLFYLNIDVQRVEIASIARRSDTTYRH